MILATWNVNSIRARLGRVLDWLRERDPDIVCLQETKVEDLHFPREPLEDAGYNVTMFGQANYNGVAILSKVPLEDVVRGLPEEGEGGERRVLAGIARDLVVVSAYAPNGTAVGHERFAVKLEWFRRLRRFLEERYPPGEKLAVCGDFNVTFDDRDVFDPIGLREELHCSTPEREALQHLLGCGLHDAFRRFHEEPGHFTWWDYRGVAFARNQGLRIDHILLGQPALETCAGVTIDRDTRTGRAPSDHAPVVATFR